MTIPGQSSARTLSQELLLRALALAFRFCAACRSVTGDAGADVQRAAQLHRWCRRGKSQAGVAIGPSNGGLGTAAYGGTYGGVVWEIAGAGAPHRK